MEIDLRINDNDTTVTADGETDLATVLRDEGYKGVKCGCDGGDCGASSVLIDGSAQMACGLSAAEADGSEIQTIEDLGEQTSLHPIQQVFVDHFAVQCGFCIPGMIMQAKDLLADNPDPTEAEVREAIDDVVCRCTGYQKPVNAILDAADRMRDDAVAADGGASTDTTIDETNV